MMPHPEPRSTKVRLSTCSSTYSELKTSSQVVLPRHTYTGVSATTDFFIIIIIILCKRCTLDEIILGTSDQIPLAKSTRKAQCVTNDRLQLIGTQQKLAQQPPR